MNDQVILSLNPGSIAYKVKLGQKMMLSWFEALDALWVHSGDPRMPHAKFTEASGGICSSVYLNCTIPLSYANLSKILAFQMVLRIREQYIGTIDWVIGSPMAGITFAHDVMHEIGAKRSAFLEKDPDNPGQFLWNRLQIPIGQVVLQIEELTTTGGTLINIRKAVDEQNEDPVTWAPCVGILVHRPPKLPADSYDDRMVIPVIEKEVWSVSPDKCELCAQGSKPIRPKGNWAKLTGKE